MFARTPPGDLAVVCFASQPMGHTVGLPLVLGHVGGSLVPVTGSR